MAANNSGSSLLLVSLMKDLASYLEVPPQKTDGFSWGEAPLDNSLAKECNQIDNNAEAPTSTNKKNLKNVM